MRSPLCWQALSDRWGIAHWLEDTSILQQRQGAPARALQLACAAATVREEIGSPRSKADQAKLEEELASARHGLSEEAVVAAETVGRTMGVAEAIKLALSTNGDAP